MAVQIKVYGSGCGKCKQLHENALEAAMRVEYPTTVDYITDIVAISMAGILSTPALVIDGRLMSQGKVLSQEAILKLLGGQGATDLGSGGCSFGCC